MPLGMGNYPQNQMHIQQSSIYPTPGGIPGMVSGGVLPPPKPSKVSFKFSSHFSMQCTTKILKIMLTNNYFLKPKGVKRRADTTTPSGISYVDQYGALMSSEAAKIATRRESGRQIKKVNKVTKQNIFKLQNNQRIQTLR